MALYAAPTFAALSAQFTHISTSPGSHGVLIESEVNIATGLPAFHFVGLADLSDSPDIFMDHEAEALQYRPKIMA